MQISEKWLLDAGACQEAIKVFKKARPKITDVSEILEALINGTNQASKIYAKERLNWSNWLLPRTLSETSKIRYAIFAAKKVLCLYENTFTKDKRPRKAIEVAETVLKSGVDTARAAAHAARAAAGAAYAAADAARAAADAAYAAANAADAAANAADAAAYAAHAAHASAYAAYAAANAADAAADAAQWHEMMISILEYGVTLLD